MLETPLDVLVIGGSIGGVSCALSLLKVRGCKVTVLERASSISAAGAVRLPCILVPIPAVLGQHLKDVSMHAIRVLAWMRPLSASCEASVTREALEKSILPMTSEHNRAVIDREFISVQENDHWNHHR